MHQSHQSESSRMDNAGNQILVSSIQYQSIERASSPSDQDLLLEVQAHQITKVTETKSNTIGYMCVCQVLRERNLLMTTNTTAVTDKRAACVNQAFSFGLYRRGRCGSLYRRQ